jgi:serine protease
MTKQLNIRPLNVVTAFALLTSTAAYASPAQDVNQADGAYKQYIVQFHAPVTKITPELFLQSQAVSLINEIGSQAIKTLPSVNAISARLSVTQLEQLNHHSWVKWIEEDPIRHLQSEFTSYAINRIQANQLSDTNTANIKVWIPDTGIDLGHEDLPGSANITGEVINTQTDWQVDTNGHGTHMAGLIAAIGDNGIGIKGVNPNEHIKLHIVKITDNPIWNNVRSSDVIAAVERCTDAGANIINMSIAGEQSSQTEELAMQAAFDEGILLVGAAGNDGNANYQYPASYSSVIAVAATNAQMHKTNTGTNPKAMTR